MERDFGSLIRAAGKAEAEGGEGGSGVRGQESGSGSGSGGGSNDESGARYSMFVAPDGLSAL